MSILHGTLTYGPEDEMVYYLPDYSLWFVWHGTPGYLGGPYIDVMINGPRTGQAVFAIGTTRNGHRIDFTEENLREEIDDWGEEGLNALEAEGYIRRFDR